MATILHSTYTEDRWQQSEEIILQVKSITETLSENLKEAKA